MLHLLLFQRTCVGCGYCCIKAQCVPGQMRYGSAEVCPGLYWDGSRYLCKLIEESSQIAAILQAGEGCCRPLNSWRKDVWQRVRTAQDAPSVHSAICVYPGSTGGGNTDPENPL